MKKSKRSNIYSVRSESRTLAERIYFTDPKHGRTKKQHYLSKQARRSVDKGRVDGVNLHDVITYADLDDIMSLI